jgi:hypothetical protein
VLGIPKILRTNSADNQTTSAGLLSYDSDGFTIKGNTGEFNQNTINQMVYSFREAPRFFQIIKIIGNGQSSRQIAHELGIIPGMGIIKPLVGGTAAGHWNLRHRGATGNCWLNLTSGQESNFNGYIQDWTDSEITIGNSYNEIGAEYIIYLFAHDPSPNGIIQCCVGNAYQPQVLGWRPQLILQHRLSGGDWDLIDAVRGLGPSGEPVFKLNTNGMETDNQDAILAIDNEGYTPNLNSAYISLVIRAPIPV